MEIGDGGDSVYVWQANLVFVSTTILFYVIGEIFKHIGKPNHVAAEVDFWKWRNIVISWLHGVISGIWILLCLVCYPEIFSDPLGFINTMTYLAVPFCAGYFFYDFIDLMQHNKLLVHWEITLHHIVMVTSFMYNWCAKIGIGFNILILMAEINSIFLHLRKLLQMSKVGYDTILYKTVSIVNLLTFIVGRELPQFRLFAAFFIDYHRVSIPYFVILFICTIIGMVINIVLFWRLIKSDVLKPYFGWGKKTSNSDKTAKVNGNNNTDFSKDE